MKQQQITLTKRQLWLASIGAGLEYYDFVIYLYLLNTFSPLFFSAHKSSGTHHAAIIGSLVLIAGAIFRPIAATFWGWWADKKGRRSSFFSIMAVMTLSAMAIALCPTTAQIGVAATGLFIIFRLLQSAAFGADLPCGIILITEHAPKNKKGFYASIMVLMVGLSSSLGAGICSLLTHWLSHQQMLAWGWRVAFMFGALLALISLFCRRNFPESPEFLQLFDSQKSNSQLKLSATIKHSLCTLLSKEQLGPILRGICLLSLPSAMVMLGTTLPILLHGTYNYSTINIYHSLTWTALLEALCIPLFAAFADKTNRKNFYRISVLLTLIAIPWLFLGLLPQGTNLALWQFMLVYHLLLGAMASCFFVLLTELFPTDIRCKNYTLTYNIAYVIMSAIPAIVITMESHIQLIPVALVLLAWTSLLSTFKRKPKRNYITG